MYSFVRKCFKKTEFVNFNLEKPMRIVAIIMLAIGLSSNVYEAVIARKFSGGEQGEYGLALKNAYEWLDRSVPQHAVIQHNPHVELDFFHALYGNRQVGVADTTLGQLYGVGRVQFFKLHRPIKALFYENLHLSEVVNLLSKNNIDMILVKKSDPIWMNHASWVWQASPVFQNEFCRIFAVSSIKR